MRAKPPGGPAWGPSRRGVTPSRKTSLVDSLVCFSSACEQMTPCEHPLYRWQPRCHWAAGVGQLPCHPMGPPLREKVRRGPNHHSTVHVLGTDGTAAEPHKQLRTERIANQHGAAEGLGGNVCIRSTDDTADLGATCGPWSRQGLRVFIQQRTLATRSASTQTPSSAARAHMTMTIASAQPLRYALNA